MKIDNSLTENALVEGIRIYIEERDEAEYRREEAENENDEQEEETLCVEVEKFFPNGNSIYIDMSYEDALLMLKNRFGKSINFLGEAVPYDSINH
jgi:hypothetical protein